MICARFVYISVPKQQKLHFIGSKILHTWGIHTFIYLGEIKIYPNFTRVLFIEHLINNTEFCLDNNEAKNET
jgi:hypothetical protein